LFANNQQSELLINQTALKKYGFDPKTGTRHALIGLMIFANNLYFILLFFILFRQLFLQEF